MQVEMTMSIDNIHIRNSYLIQDREVMLYQIGYFRKVGGSKALLRSDKSLVNEWRAHNLLYDLHLFRSHTRDVDLDWPARWYTEAAYAILSFLYPHR